MVDPLAHLEAPLEITELVRQHHAALYRYAYRLTGRVQDAEDLVQQAFLIAQQKLEQVRCEETVRAWLFTVLRNAYLKLRGKAAAMPLVGLDVDLSILVQETANDPIDSEGLQQALRELPSEFRIVVLMFYFEDQSYKQIAEALNVPIGTVMSRLSRAKAHLRRQLTTLTPDRRDDCKSTARPNGLKTTDTLPIAPKWANNPVTSDSRHG